MRDSSFGCQEHQPQKPSLVVDIDLVLGLFSNERKKAIDSFEAFHEISSNDNCLDIEENRRLRRRIINKANSEIDGYKQGYNIKSITI